MNCQAPKTKNVVQYTLGLATSRLVGGTHFLNLVPIIPLPAFRRGSEMQSSGKSSRSWPMVLVSSSGQPSGRSCRVTAPSPVRKWVVFLRRDQRVWEYQNDCSTQWGIGDSNSMHYINVIYILWGEWLEPSAVTLTYPQIVVSFGKSSEVL